MIVEGKQTKVVDVEIDPTMVVVDMYQTWAGCQGIPFGAKLMDGYWRVFERTGHESEWVQYRLATKDEITIVDAFKTISMIAKDFN